MQGSGEVSRDLVAVSAQARGAAALTARACAASKPARAAAAGLAGRRRGEGAGSRGSSASSRGSSSSRTGSRNSADPSTSFLLGTGVLNGGEEEKMAPVKSASPWPAACSAATSGRTVAPPPISPSPSAPKPMQRGRRQTRIGS